MAILMLVKGNQAHGDWKFAGDVVGVFEDDHIFTPSELASSEFITIKGTRALVVSKLKELDVQYTTAYYNPNTDSWSFVDPFVDGQEEKEVWSPGGNPLKWYFLEVPFVYRWNVDSLTAEEKQLLETIDITNPSVDNAVKKLMKDLVVANPSNGVEATDLRNKTP